MKRFYGIVSDKLDIIPRIQTARFETLEQALEVAERAARFHFGDRGQVVIGVEMVLDGDSIPEYNPGTRSTLYDMVRASRPALSHEQKKEVVRILQEQWEHYYHGGAYTLATYASAVLAGGIELCEPMTIRELWETVYHEQELELDFALNMDEHGFSLWGGIKVRKEFDQTIVLVGGYGGGIAALEKDFSLADLENAIETAVCDLDVDKFGEKVLYVDRSELIK